ncbi:hypothetical protein H2198_005875 [Neophaeococcomyces mojaviensis]|uniref:Uncharacterized protein n=1 Tax=Neophaeococcomyces mojaviensis TaxID=3383035 RepID=A0ACC3A4U6_9EURO|nr:hypothetical protein H2198_005875 [Knufia sp. JES_112]
MAFDPIGRIAAWITASAYVEPASQLNGGWEKWATTDITLYLLAQAYDVIPQAHSFTNTESSDIEVIQSAPGGGALAPRLHTDIIEMKCSGWPIGNDLVGFMQGIQDDAKKLYVNQLDGAILAGGATHTKWAIGIVRRRQNHSFIDLENDLTAAYPNYPNIVFQHPVGTNRQYQLRTQMSGEFFILWCNPT